MSNHMSAAQMMFNRASARIMCNHDTAFYAAMLMQLPVIYTDTLVPTAGVDAKSKLYINPQWFASRENVEEAVFTLVHECEHLLALHPQRLSGRDPSRWNIAADAVINANLKRHKIGQFINGAVDVPEAWDKTADYMYEHPPEQPQGGGGQGGEGEGGSSGGAGEGQGDDEKGPGGIGSDLFEGDLENPGEPVTPQDMRENIEHAKSIIASAAQACRVAGTLSAEMERRVEDALDVKTPWHEILERFMMDHSDTDYSWSRPNRRFISGGMYLPSLQSIAQLGTCVILRDVSGSCSEEQAPFMAHINSICTRCEPAKLHVLDVSTRVHHDHEYTRDELPVDPTIHGGGGTDLRAGFTYADENIDDIDVMIVLTDGFTSWPSAKPDYPVIVVCTTDVDVNFGDEVIRYEVD